MLKEQKKGFYDFDWIRCINDILLSVGDLIFLKLIQSITPNLLEWTFHSHYQICIFSNGMRMLTFPQKENNIFYLKTIPNLKNI